MFTAERGVGGGPRRNSKAVPPIRYVTDQVANTLLVRLFGELSTATAPQVRTTLLKCLAEQPDALVVDLAEAVVREPTALSVFTAVARQASWWPGTPLLLAAGDARVRRLLSGGGYGRLAVFPTTAQALDNPLPHPMPSLSDSLLPVPGTARRGRELAAEACTRWQLADLVEPAGLIASELVTNAVRHARTMADLRFSLGRRYLLVAVRDESTVQPRLTVVPPLQSGGGRGLMLVDAIAARWGSVPAHDGKVVWASLPVAGHSAAS
jgi:anti-anti-sigma regulatory factor